MQKLAGAGLKARSSYDYLRVFTHSIPLISISFKVWISLF